MLVGAALCVVCNEDDTMSSSVLQNGGSDRSMQRLSSSSCSSPDALCQRVVQQRDESVLIQQRIIRIYGLRLVLLHRRQLKFDRLQWSNELPRLSVRRIKYIFRIDQFLADAGATGCN